MHFSFIEKIIPIGFLLISTQVLADSGVVSAYYKCNKNHFSLYASVSSDSGNINPPANMKMLKIGNNKLTCKVKSSAIESNVYLSGPGHNGLCGDPGTIYINGLKIDGATIIESEPMLLYCESKPTITNLDIKKSENSLVIRICKGNWNWGDTYDNFKCEEQSIANPSIKRDALKRAPYVKR